MLITRLEAEAAPPAVLPSPGQPAAARLGGGPLSPVPPLRPGGARAMVPGAGNLTPGDTACKPPPRPALAWPAGGLF